MSRHGYAYDFEGDAPREFWWQAVKNAIKGKRGQTFLRELAAVLDAMPNKRLIAGELEAPDGEVCALGAVGRSRGVKMEDLDPDAFVDVAKAFRIATCLAQEVMYINDESRATTPEQRWELVRQWVKQNIPHNS